MDAIKAAATELLETFYKVEAKGIPEPLEKSKWLNDNKRGFFLGIIRHGRDAHIMKLYVVLLPIRASAKLLQ